MLTKITHMGVRGWGVGNQTWGVIKSDNKSCDGGEVCHTITNFTIILTCSPQIPWEDLQAKSNRLYLKTKK